MITKQIYRISLDDYALPAASSIVKHYYGSLDDIESLIHSLESDSYTARTYATTIRAYYNFKAGDLTACHIINGQTMQLLTPVQAVAESTIMAFDETWNFYNGVMMPTDMRAKYMELQQLIIHDGHHYHRIIRPYFDGLEMNHPEYDGWYAVGKHCFGFPHMYKVLSPNTMYLELYVEEQISSILDDCLTKMDEIKYADLTEALNDIFGHSLP